MKTKRNGRVKIKKGNKKRNCEEGRGNELERGKNKRPIKTRK